MNDLLASQGKEVRGRLLGPGASPPAHEACVCTRCCVRCPTPSCPLMGCARRPAPSPIGAQVPSPHHACACRSPDAHIAHAKQPQVRTPAVIQSNPEQSKHLETARLKISGLWIDLVNLRSETYAAGSRIPQVRAVPRPPLR